MSIPFIDLKAQYRALQPQIQERINRVLEHGQYIMGPEVKELEEKLESYTGARHCITAACKKKPISTKFPASPFVMKPNGWKLWRRA